MSTGQAMEKKVYGNTHPLGSDRCATCSHKMRSLALVGGTSSEPVAAPLPMVQFDTLAQEDWLKERRVVEPKIWENLPVIGRFDPPTKVEIYCLVFLAAVAGFTFWG